MDKMDTLNNSNGLLIQWGYSSSSSNATYIYLPTSFYNTSYCVTITFVEPGNGMNVVCPLVTLKNTSNFRSVQDIQLVMQMGLEKVLILLVGLLLAVGNRLN